MAAVATGLLALLGYPLALALARAPRRSRPILVALVLVPFWTSLLIRTYAWIAILKPDGLLNAALLHLGLVARPLAILDTDAAVLIGLVYAYLPFMVLPLYAVLVERDDDLLDAARDLGASPLGAFWTVTAPLSLPGLAAGALLCFIPITGEFVIPDLLGGAGTPMLGRVVWSEFFANRDWPVAAALSLVATLVLIGPILLVRAVADRRPGRVA
jgi:putrescine transport system permease protein